MDTGRTVDTVEKNSHKIFTNKARIVRSVTAPIWNRIDSIRNLLERFVLNMQILLLDLLTHTIKIYQNKIHHYEHFLCKNGKKIKFSLNPHSGFRWFYSCYKWQVHAFRVVCVRVCRKPKRKMISTYDRVVICCFSISISARVRFAICYWISLHAHHSAR